MHLIKILIGLSFLLVVSCKKKVEGTSSSDVSLSNGIAILNEGLFQYNNSSVSWVDLDGEANSNALFQDKNGRSLGDTGNDMLHYGGKVYIAVSVSSTVEVLNYSDFTSIKQVSMLSSGVSKEPRKLIAYENFVFVSCFDGYVDVLDTNSLNIVKRIHVGSNPEGLGISNGKLYVANSGGLNSPMDSTVSVIDLSNQEEMHKIKVGLNPGGIEVDDAGNVYVVTRGDYGSVPSRLHRINATTDIVSSSYGFDVSSVESMNDKLLISYFDYDSNQNKVSLFNTLNETIETENYLNTTNIQTLYGCQYDADRNRVYVFDARGYTVSGKIQVYDQSGNWLTEYEAGLNPSNIVNYE